MNNRNDRKMSAVRETSVDSGATSPAYERLVCTAVVLGAGVFLAWHAHLFFPNATGRLGHDYSYFVPTLVAGYFWQQQNGWLTPPFFTPAFCGGMPLLANPQSVFFSIPQLLLRVLEPTTAMFATLLVSAGIGAAGTYVLVRRYCQTSASAGALGASLFLLNGFLFYRLVIGHLTYHAFAVVPLFACVVVSSQRASWTTTTHAAHHFLVRVVLGGLLVAYVTYGGALNFEIPVALAVACTLLMVQIERGFDRVPWLVLAASCAWGTVISAMKLVPAIMLAGQFPRPYLPDYLFGNPLDMVRVMFKAFFVPASLPDLVWASRHGLGRHELEFGVSVVPPLLITLAACRLITLAVYRRRLSGFSRQPRLLWLGLAGLLLIPIVLSSGPRWWGLFLLHVPIINNNATFVRWWAIYVLPLVVIAARCLDLGMASAAGRSALLAGCIALTIGQEAGRDSRYYAEQPYDPGPVTSAYRQVRNGSAVPAIAAVGSDAVLPDQSNDAFIEGASAWPCYEPLFGYNLEWIPKFELIHAPVARTSSDQRLNLVNPAEYFAQPKPPARTWRFDVSHRSEALNFANYLPYRWNEPWWQVAALKVTGASIGLSVAYLLLFLGYALISDLPPWKR